MNKHKINIAKALRRRKTTTLQMLISGELSRGKIGHTDFTKLGVKKQVRCTHETACILVRRR